MGEHLPNYNGGNFGWRSMDGLSFQGIEGSSMSPTNVAYGYPQAPQHRNEQNIMYQSNASGRLDSWNIFPGQGQVGVTGESSGPDGRRASLRFRSVTDNHEADGNLDPHHQFLAPIGNNFGPGSDLPRTANHENTSPNPSSGIDPSLMTRSCFEDCANFGAEIDQIDGGGGGGDTQDEGLLRNPEDLDIHSPIGSSASMFSRSDTVSPTSTAPLSGHRTGQPVSSESSVTTCPTCDNDPDCVRRPVYHGTSASQKKSMRRHNSREHSDLPTWSYQCSLDKNGSPCRAIISDRADNRRRHVERVHPTEAEELPQRDVKKRNPNSITNARLDECFFKVPRRT